MNRCVPAVETNTTHRRYCEFPSCDDLDLPCVAVVGVSNTLWEMSMEEQDEKCMREIEIEQVAETKTPIDTEAAATGVLIEYFLSFATTLNNALDMLKENALQIFVFGIGFATLFGFGWMILLFVCAGFAVYFSLLMVALILLCVTILFAYKGNVGGPLVTTFVQSVVNGTIVQLDNVAHDTVVEGLLHSDMVETAIHVTMSQESDLQQLYQILAAVALLLLIIYLTLLGVASGQINRTVALVKEATLCVHNSKAMVFFPLVISFFHLVLVLFIAFTLAYLHTNPATSYSSQLAAISESYTAAHNEIAEGLAAMNADMTNVAEKDVVGDWLNALQYLDADQILFYEDCYIVFGLVWSYFFLAAIGTTTISGCVIYYFFMDEDTAGHVNHQFADNQTDYVVTTMFYYTLRYNLGSMALGSFVLAVVETLVAALEFVENQTKVEKQSNPVMKVVLKCCKCCLFCFERCLKFVSSYAYIFVFMQNTGFCMACYRTWRMMSQYPVQLSINSVVQKVLFVMQSISIPLMCTGWAYWSFLSSSGQLKHGFTGVSSDVLIAAGLPAFCVFVLSMLVARSFASVYEQVVTALTTCVLTDIEQYHAKYARSQLREAFDLPVKKISIDDDFDDDYARQASAVGGRSARPGHGSAAMMACCPGPWL